MSFPATHQPLVALEEHDASAYGHIATDDEKKILQEILAILADNEVSVLAGLWMLHCIQYELQLTVEGAVYRGKPSLPDA